jgi:hypothetical protein
MGANRQPVLGHIDCPVCEFPEMQVKLDKNGQASAYCPDCAQQLFTRNDHKSGKLLARMRPVAAGAAPAVPAPPKTDKPIEIPTFVPPVKAPPSRQAGAGDANEGADRANHQPEQKNAPAASDAVQAPVVRSSWFSPLIGSTARKAGK